MVMEKVCILYGFYITSTISTRYYCKYTHNKPLDFVFGYGEMYKKSKPRVENAQNK